ncbi:hypothetical protein ACHQM5_016797 [Ranunculus cassubicifolius]
MAFPSPVLLEWSEKLLDHWLSFTLLSFSLLFLLWLNRKAVNKLPPSPPKLPIIGHLHHIGKHPHRSLRALSNKYGPLMLLQLGQQPTVVVSSAEMAKQILKTHDINFANRPATTGSKLFLYGGKDMAFAPYGGHWRLMRKLSTQDLLSVQKIQSFQFVRKEEMGNMVNKIKKSCSTGGEVNLSDMIMNVINNIISRVALGKSFETESGKSAHAKLIEETMEIFGSSTVEDMFPSLKWIDVLTGLDRRMKNTSKAIQQCLNEVIEEHLTARKHNNNKQGDFRDFVDVWLDCEIDSKAGEYTRESLIAVVMNMFVAGTDTTYTALEWLMAELIRHPEVMKKLQDEVRRVVGTKGEVDEKDIKQMDYLKCVIKENLRLHGPAPFLLPRVSAVSNTIDGYYVPAKTKVLVNTWAISRDPEMWDRPDEFIPERFMDKTMDYRGLNFEFIPFGAGRRICPGISFGVNSMECIIANLLYLFDWEVPKDGIDMTEVFGLSLKMKFPLRLVPTSHTF